MTIHGVWIDEHLLMEESNVEQPKPVVRTARIGKMKKDAHRAIHKGNVKKKNRAKNRVAKAARKKHKK